MQSTVNVNKRSSFNIAWIFVFLLLTATNENAFCQDQSIYLRHFVHHENGDFCNYTPPDASFIFCINNDYDRILIENAPRWDTEGVPSNIEGNGTFGVELGNFINPPLQVGDTVVARFICKSTNEYGIRSDVVTSIPWYLFPQHVYMGESVIPGKPVNIQLNIEGDHRILSWNADNTKYHIYRRERDLINSIGTSRMMYERIGIVTNEGSFIDENAGSSAYGYIIIPERSGVFGMHSDEVVDFPAVPINVNAAIAGDDPFSSVITWEPGNDLENLSYKIFKSDIPNFIPGDDYTIGITEELYFIDENVIENGIYYYSVSAVNGFGISSDPSPIIKFTAEQQFGGLPDLNVLFISRSQKYKRFEIEYTPGGYNPHPKPGTENIQHYPEDGELMTYTANIKNTGGGSVDSFMVKWYVDSELIQTSFHGSIYQEQRIKSRLQYPWDADDPYYVKCELTPVGATEELSTLNNYLENRSNAIAFDIYIEEGMVGLFQGYRNHLNSYCFEDWIQFNINHMMDLMDEAVYENISPEGVHERIFIDSITYVPNGTLSGGNHAPFNPYADGAWGFSLDSNWFQVAVIGHDDLGYEPALIHELSHQIGLIDLYAMDQHGSTVHTIEPRTGEPVELTPVVPFDNPVLYYSSRKNDLMHGPGNDRYTDHTAGGLMKNLGKRRGYYGDYLFDIPLENTLVLKKPDGSVLQDYEVWFYWSEPGVGVGNITKFRGVTNSSGEYTFPHETHSDYEGRIDVQNPFSSIHSDDPHVVGLNSTFLIRAVKGDSVGYSFMDICDFNVAYWNGDTAHAFLPHTIEQWRIIEPNNYKEDESKLPGNYKLNQNYPNPFNPNTTFSFELPNDSVVSIVIYNTIGEKVVSLLGDKHYSAGRYNLEWNASGFASGVYLYKIKARSIDNNELFVNTKKMTLIK
ncbi:MAG: T9SS type A sorting domain-containing protein [Melioribacteraceae bacterium]|nr:T9SS type A sorting domain-containing protein [Melioribacteraceae bacterium]MCF8353142.1 T9SS type A sorting domain-containing protein [Melioribacteraceae bacterium]MCF8393158.1 T9SS type A sorting domain-containing protein [Melioribacteraceae bacterium]MCF8418061.1 T9SS type A sorting domain-containing protein [Melioribacteraceae bacterium]